MTDLTFDGKAETREAARLILNALTRLGFADRRQDGTLRTVQVEGLAYDPANRVGMVRIDTRRLPHRAAIPRLAAEGVAHHLTGVVHRPVRCWNTTALIYLVDFRDHPTARRLPKRLPLDLRKRPNISYPIGFGMTRSGEAFWLPLGGCGHFIVAGQPGAGKSAFLRSLLHQLLRQPDPILLALTDMEDVTFPFAAGLPNLLAPVATDETEAGELTEALLVELERRAGLYQVAEGWPENIEEYNAQAAEPLARVVGIYDEFSALIQGAGVNSRLHDDISALAMRGRKFGISLVLAGQDFKADILNTRITNQARTRLCFRVAKPEASKVVLGRRGAERLTVPGRAIVSHDGRAGLVQTFWVSKEEAIATCRALSAGGPLLDGLELRVAEVVVDLGTAGLEALYQHFGPAERGGVSYRQLKAVLKTFERRGWVVYDGPGRVPGPVLGDLVEAARSGS